VCIGSGASLDLLVHMQKNGIVFASLSTQADRWRAEVLKAYLDAVGAAGATVDLRRRRAYLGRRGCRLDVDGFVLTRVASTSTAAGPGSGLREHARRALRPLVRLYHRHPILFLALFIVPPFVFVFLDFLPWTHHWLKGAEEHHHATLAVLEHLSVSLLVGVGVLTWWSRVKRREVLKDYRREAFAQPADFVEWSRGETPVVRVPTCELLATSIKSSEDPAVVVVHGRPGTGRTSCIVGLVRELAAQGLIPVPVRARRDGPFEPEDLARQTFRAYVDRTLSSDQPSEAVWYQATAMRDVVVLVDDLDDEIIDKLSNGGAKRFQSTINDLRKHQIAVVLATTGDLPLGDIQHMREDLDLFSREEAAAYVQATLDRDRDRAAALAALDKLHQPVDHFLVAPFYVDLIVRLQKAEIPLHDLHEQTDRWRADVLKKYLTAVWKGQIRLSAAGLDSRELLERTREAKLAADAVAKKLTIADVKLSVARSSLDAADRALGDAEDLNLLWRGGERVGLAADDLGAYLFATRSDGDPSELLDEIEAIASNRSRDKLRRRHERYVRSALIFWHIQHEKERAETFEAFATKLEGCKCVLPKFVVAAVRIACSCGLHEYDERVADLAEKCADSLNTPAEQDAEPWRAEELLGLVRALADWPYKGAHLLLWKLATTHNTEIEWWAAKGLAMARGNPVGNLEKPISTVLENADPKRPETSRHDNDLGNKLAVLAWILPALRDGVPGSLIEERLKRLVEICRTRELSPLRGEISLAQGLKLAIMNSTKLAAANVKRVHERNFELVEELLLDSQQPVRFWHARLVLVHALLAHAWEHRGRVAEVRSDLGKVEFKEEHLLVQRGIELARDGLAALARASDGTPLDWSEYMWSHEREAVRWVQQGKDAVAQLAADVVLLSNMTYRLRRRETELANAAALKQDLPRCIRRSSDRGRIDDRCRCGQKLCLRPEEPADRAVLATRARFSASFCRNQAHLVATQGAPEWIWTPSSMWTAFVRNKRLAYLRDKRMQKFWFKQASHIESVAASNGSNGTPAGAGSTAPEAPAATTVRP
jgi:hypothetical protein